MTVNKSETWNSAVGTNPKQNKITITYDFLRGIAGKSKASCLGVDFHGSAQSLLGTICHAGKKQKSFVLQANLSHLGGNMNNYNEIPHCYID